MKALAPLLVALAASAAMAQEEPGLEASIEADRKKEPAQTSLRGSEAKDLAGAHGDAVVAAQMLPGVAREPAGTGQLVVWGAAPNETRLLIDGIEVPALYHGGGLRSVVPSELVRRLELAPAAFGAQWGRALGGVLEVEMSAPDVAASRLAVDPLDAHASINASLGDGQLFGGFRYSLVDRIVGPALSETAKELFPLPRYWDGQLVGTIPLRSGEKLELLFFGSSDSGTRELNATTSVSRGDSSLSRWGRLGLRYKRTLDEASDVTVVAWAGDDLQSQGSFSGPAFANQTSWAQSAGLRASYRTLFAEGLSLTLGADGLFTHTHLRRAGSLTTPAREGDVTFFGQPPGVDVTSDDWTVQQGDFALYAQGDLDLGRFTVTPGLRLDFAATDTSAIVPTSVGSAPQGSSQLEPFVEPRLQIAFRATDRLRIFAAGGLHHQAAAPADLSAAFGAPTLGSSSAGHFTAGGSYRVARPLTVEATGFLRLESDLATRSDLPTPVLAQAFVQQGTGKSYGVQIVARWQGGGPLSGFVSALISRSERQDAPTVATRLFDFDQPVALTAAASYKWDRNLLGARVRYASGFPRTPVIDSFFDSQQGREEPIFGAQNSVRLPAFVALDLTAARSFELGDGRSLRVYLEVENATAHENAEDFIYDSSFTTRNIIQGLPPLALLGLELVL
ncbi:MAG TPA: TonB-dependent receptor plug domain-containing protein [Myxococcales bacterium]|nr:TonB-dependent receptor plug domain-containing protein [Myxococcales bacterium]